jgi:predicted kinase
MSPTGLLVIMGGLPATGKTTIGRAVARARGAVHLRVDTIEEAIVASGALTHPVGPVGYAVAYAVAEENLRLGLTVVADTVNPLPVTRDAWRDVAARIGVPYVDVEVICSDPAEHERRAGSRDVADQRKPAWAEITRHEYEPRTDERLVLDTARTGVESCVAMVLFHLVPASRG